MSSCWAYQCEHHIEAEDDQLKAHVALIVQAMQNYAIANKLTPFISMQK
jgi:hypothetical protein